jgi:YD repeat-containing protein
VLVLTAVVGLIAVIGVVVYAVKGPGPDPNGALESAVAHSVDAKTADVALSVSVGAAGFHESIDGNGTTNFVTDASNMTMTYNAQGRSIVERAIIDGSTGYFNVGPIVGEVAPGKSWLSLNVSRGSTSGPNGVAGGGIFSDPNTMVEVLRTTGTTVSMLGSSTVDGVTVQGYAIDLSAAGIAKVVRSSQVPASVRAELSQVHFDRLDYVVDIDGANHLKEVRVTGGFGAEGLQATVTSAMHFSDYGIPVHVTPPPADEVIPLLQFEKLQAQAQGHANT